MVSTTLTLETFAQQCQQQAASLASRDYTEPLRVCAMLVKSDVSENFQGSHDPDGNAWLPLRRPRLNSKGGDLPLLDTGILRASVVASGQGHIEEITPTTLTVGTNLDRAAIHQYGGTITPTKAKALTIPLTKEAQRAGSPRNFGRKLFVFDSGAHGFLAERRGKGKQARLTLHYLFLSQVTIPQRQFLGFGDRLLEKIDEAIGGWLEKQV